jgi:hypothetical protein
MPPDRLWVGMTTAIGSVDAPAGALLLVPLETDLVPRTWFIKALLWLVTVVGALIAGMAIQWQIDMPVPVGHARAEVHSHKSIEYVWMELVRLRDGSVWQRCNPDWPLPDEADGAGAKSGRPSAPHLHLRPHASTTAAKSTY